MKFAVGDMVMLSPIAGKKVDLTMSPSHLMSVGDPGGNHLSSKDVGVIITIDRTDGRNAYVLGPNGCGWVPGAFLVRVR